MTEPVAQVSKTIDAPAAEVWEALTDQERASTYFMGAEVKSDFAVGSPITFAGEHEGRSYADTGEVLEAEREKRLKFTHFSSASGAEDKPANYNTVTIDLEPQGERTKVTLTQAHRQGGVTEADRQHRAKYEKSWSSVLDGLSRTVRQ